MRKDISRCKDCKLFLDGNCKGRKNGHVCKHYYTARGVFRGTLCAPKTRA